MRGRGIGRLLRAGKRAVGLPSAGRGVILLYHRIAEADIDPWDLCVSPRHFKEQLGVLKALGNCVKVCNVVPALAKERGPVLSVSFDDGYADNATAAAPILADEGVPATVFVVSGAVGSEGEFWWDALERVFLMPGALPARLELAVGERVHAWDLGAAAAYSAADFRRDAGWRADDEGTTGRRQEIFVEVWQLLVGQPSATRDTLLARILDWAGVDAAARPDYAIMSGAQLARLAAQEGIEIGAHTRSHPSLPDLPLPAQIEEVCRGKADLESRIGRPVVSFSYPFGRLTGATEWVVQKEGFAAACTSRCQAILPGPHGLRMPRVQVKDWDGPTFRKVVMSYL
jgi:peptidoglycan/xylan/chitin deacetylase (PgdA/CDA1 family)